MKPEMLLQNPALACDELGTNICHVNNGSVFVQEEKKDQHTSKKRWREQKIERTSTFHQWHGDIFCFLTAGVCSVQECYTGERCCIKTKQLVIENTTRGPEIMRDRISCEMHTSCTYHAWLSSAVLSKAETQVVSTFIRCIGDQSKSQH